MPIRKKRNQYEARFQLAGRPVSKTFGNRRDAAEFERTERGRHTDRVVGRASEYGLEEAIAKWLTGEARTLQSFKDVRGKAKLLYPFVKGRLLTEVVDVADQVMAAGLDKGLKPVTINRRLAVLRRVAKLAFKKWEPAWLDRDLGAKITMHKGELPRFEKATPEQLEKLLQAAGKRPGAAIEFLALTGLRPGEMVRVQPHHFEEGSVAVYRNKTGKPRFVPLAAGLQERFPWGMTYSELRTGFEKAREAAGMPWLQIRDLRRTFGSWIVQRTGSLKAAQDLLGHTTPTITAAHYAHLLQGHLREAINTLPTFPQKAVKA